jgi:hypothetical protein
MKKISLLLLSLTIVSVNCIEFPQPYVRKISISKRANLSKNLLENLRNSEDYYMSYDDYILHCKPENKWKKIKEIKETYDSLEIFVKKIGFLFRKPTFNELNAMYKLEMYDRFIAVIVDRKNPDALDLSDNNKHALFKLRKMYFKENPIQQDPIQQDPIQQDPIQQRPYGFLYITSLVIKQLMK